MRVQQMDRLALYLAGMLAVASVVLLAAAWVTS